MRFFQSLRHATSTIALLVGSAGVAHAQTDPAAESAAAPEAPAADQSADQGAVAPAADQAATTAAAEPEIVVTGSRIARRDYSAVSSVVTLDSSRLERSGQATLEAVLNTLPQMGVGTGGTTQQNRTGIARINLRGLGEARSLVLLDGRRLQPGEPSGAADLNVLPGFLISSIETITGGASAAYGSDAMAGVVNIRLQPHFSGITASGRVLVTDQGRGTVQEYNLALGDDFDGGRGNAFLALSYADRGQIQRKDRDFFRVSVLNSRIARVIASNGSNAPSQAAIDQVFASYGYAPGTVNRTTGLSFNDDGTIFTPAPGVGREIANYRHGFDDLTLLIDNALTYNQGYTYELVAPLQRYSLFGRVEHEVTDSIDLYADGYFTNYEVSSGGATPSIGTSGTSATVPVTNPFLPADFRTLLASRANPNAPVTINYRFDQLGVSTVLSDHTTYQITAGLRGQVGIRDWTFNAYVTRGETREDEKAINRFSLGAVQQLLNAPDGGASLCAGGLNLFGAASAVSPACLDYIRYDTNNSYQISQTMAEGSLSGSLFALPAGDLRFAAGATWRHESYEVNVDEAVAAGLIPGDLSGPSTSGDRNVAEIFGELLIPVLSDLPLIRKLELDIGYRHSDYTLSGGVDSYTANATWEVTNFLTVRGGYSRAIRAPSLQDLYASAIQAQLRVGSPSATGTGGDPCDVRTSYRLGPNGTQLRNLCVALGVPSSIVDSYTSITQSIFGQTTGNPNLDNEDADTYTLGVVLQSPFSSPVLSRFRASVDFFDITINNAIGQLPLATALSRCYNLDGVSNTSYDPANPSCAFFPRVAATGQIERLQVPLLNLAQYHTRGIDVQLDWQVDLEDIGLNHAGTFLVNMIGTYLDKFEIQEVNPGPVLDYAGSSQSPIDPNGRSSVLPRWKSVTTFTHRLGPVETSIVWRYIGSIRDVSTVTNPNSTTPGARAYNYFDASLRWQINRTASVRVGVNNIFDTEPPIISDTIGNTDTQTYDVIGRAYYLSVQLRL